VHRTVTRSLTLGLAAVSMLCASADVIHLKNGKTIWADQVRESGSHIEYDVGEDTYAIPKSLVDRIEPGGSPVATAPAANTTDLKDLPQFTPADGSSNDPTLSDKVIRNGQVDADVLLALEKTGNDNATAEGYFIAGKHEFEHGNLVKARSYFETALRFDAQNPAILNYYASLLVKTGNAAEALPYAQRAVSVAPNSPDTLTVLGFVQFAMDRTREAIQSWKKSLALRPDSVVQKYLEKAEREASVHSEFSERESSHFTLHFEGKETSPALREQLLSTLEAQYDDLAGQFGTAPRNSIPVAIYTDQAFFDITNAPSWTGAVNDGKLRIPVHGISTVTPELARVLKHELAHSFINQLSAGRCPQWLNEGIAQLLEPKQVVNGRLLAKLFQAQQEIPLNALEGSFMRFSSAEATVAYDESLAAAQYISETYGMPDLQRVLARLAEGSSTEAALQAVIHSGYGQLESDVGKYLIDKYGA
jgi:tetratricopeptide (TPR) repeat protein